MKYFSFPDRMIRCNKLNRSIRTNATIMPASLLPFKAKYTQVANQLPSGSVLILTPPIVLSKQRSTLVKVAEALRSNGYHVKTLSFS
jgi:hypothetical protein